MKRGAVPASIDFAANFQMGNPRKWITWKLLDMQHRYGEAYGGRSSWCKYKTYCFVFFLRLFVHVYVCSLFILLFVNENGFAHSPSCLVWFRFMIGISPRIGVGVMSSNLGGDDPFLLVNVGFSYRARGVILVIPICFLWY